MSSSAASASCWRPTAKAASPGSWPPESALWAPRPGPRLAALADVRSPPADDDLANRAPASRAGLAGPGVDQEPVLEGATGAVQMPKIVDRRALGVDPGGECLLDGVPQARPLCPGQPARRPQRMDPGAAQSLVGIDVPDPCDPPLVEHERLHRR